MLKFSIFLTAVMLVFSSCASHKTLNYPNATEDINQLQESLKNGGEGPTAEQYQRLRNGFLGNMSQLKRLQEKKMGSPAKKVKNVIAFVGVLVGTGGTIASLAVDDEDTKSSIAQASSAVAGVSGIIGLLPFGSENASAKSIVKYLGIQLPAFEQRWPENIEKATLSAPEWDGFKSDILTVQSVVDELNR